MIKKFSTLSIFISCAGILAISHWFTYHTLNNAMCIENSAPIIVCRILSNFTIYVAIVLAFIYGAKASRKTALLSLFIPIISVAIEVAYANQYYRELEVGIRHIILNYAVPIFIVSTITAYIVESYENKSPNK